MQRCSTSSQPRPLIDIKIFWLIHQLVNYWRTASANIHPPVHFHRSCARFVLTARQNLLDLCFLKRPLGRNYHKSFVFICICVQRKHSELYEPDCCSVSASGSFEALLRGDDTCSHQGAVEKTVPKGLLAVFMNSSATHKNNSMKHLYKHLIFYFNSWYLIFINVCQFNEARCILFYGYIAVH